jgi:ATP-binding cassette, subfamily B, bacterial
MAFFGGLDAEKYDRQYQDSDLVVRILRYFTKYRSLVVLVVAGFAIGALISAIQPVLIATIIDRLENDIQAVPLVIGGLAVAVLIDFTGFYIRRLTINQLVGRVVADMRRDAFRSAVHRDLSFYDTQKTGKVISRITSDTQEFGDVLVFTSEVIAQLISVAVLLVILLNRSVTMTLVLLLTIPMFAVAAWSFRALARRVTRQGSRMMAVVNDSIQEAVTGISVAKNYRQEAKLYQEFVAVNRKSYDVNLRRGFVLALVFPVMNFLIGVAIGIVIYAGAIFVVNGQISAGSWYLYIQGVDRFLFPVINLASFWSQFQQGLSAVERVFALIDAENQIRQSGEEEILTPAGRIQLTNVDFGYTDERVLEDFSLDIQPGESVAFVGHTGAGKSTIAKIVARFYEFQDGQVQIDGHDIRALDLPAYRATLGIVPQEPFLFRGTVMENVRYARPDATEEEVREIAYSIGEGEWVDALPDGLYSDVGLRGARLSMGQRQLVSLMRVLVQRPSIFILDEATASIDPFTEMQIQEAIELVLSKSTSILIAHRLSTVQRADRIIVIADGRIIEQGNHDSLLASGGHYAELYNTYFRHQSLTYVESARERFEAGAD